MKKFVWVVLFVSCAACSMEKSSPTAPTVPNTPAATPTAPTPSVTVKGLLSFNFDDGHRCSYENALPLLDAASLKSTNYIITRQLGTDYIGKNEILSIESRGHEVGNHTRTHNDLTLMTESQVQDEIDGAKQDLVSMGVKSIETFAYPFGAYNNALIGFISSHGYLGARSTDNGANQNSTNRFALKRQNLGGDVTIKDVQGWIDASIANNTWLILLSHHIDHDPNQYSITPELFRQIVDYVALKKIKVVTNREGIHSMGL
jgi:peptidoglycan/xylan/chitin deacetylase (PgdA/CDA1 family)